MSRRKPCEIDHEDLAECVSYMIECSVCQKSEFEFEVRRDNLWPEEHFVKAGWRKINGVILCPACAAERAKGTG